MASRRHCPEIHLQKNLKLIYLAARALEVFSKKSLIWRYTNWHIHSFIHIVMRSRQRIWYINLAWTPQFSAKLLNRNCYRLSRVSWALAQIACLLLRMRVALLLSKSAGLKISGSAHLLCRLMCYIYGTAGACWLKQKILLVMTL